jgi:DtxR family Mn-dependent transcriptional regulator
VVQAKQAARAKDIADRLQVNSSSVTGALHGLKERGLVNYEPYDLITLTPRGLRTAREVVRRHEALRSFFVEVLGIAETEAESAACRMEHAMSPLVFDRLVRFVEFVGNAPNARLRWDNDLGEFRSGKSSAAQQAKTLET